MPKRTLFSVHGFVQRGVEGLPLQANKQLMTLSYSTYESIFGMAENCCKSAECRPSMQFFSYPAIFDMQVGAKGLLLRRVSGGGEFETSKLQHI